VRFINKPPPSDEGGYTKETRSVVNPDAALRARSAIIVARQTGDVNFCASIRRCRNDLAADVAPSFPRMITGLIDGAHGAGEPTRLRIFIVEDHVDTARGLAMYLRASGHEVHVAADVQSARQLATEIEYDILLSDIGLPDGTGWDLLKELKARRPITAIAMSGYNTDSDRARSKAAGFREHLPKPLTPEELDAAFERALGGGGA
jgi:CheY-like chemotaxis protein